MQVLPIELPASTIRIGEAIIAVAPLEARETRNLPILATAKESLKCSILPSQDILENMGGYVLVFFPDLAFDLRQIILLIVVADGLLRIAISITPFREGCVVQLAAT